ncbi:MAG TPA: MBL fold metallo-hydrolase RNA specificity domain-containing protein, partial [Nitrospiria bacterium]
YALGKSQEILKFLGDRGYTVCLPKKTLEIVGVYESNGVSFKNYERLSTGNLYGKVVLLPPYLARTRLVKRIGNKRTAVLTGWALDPGAAQRYGAEKAFAFSDHADFDELNEYVRRANPDKIFTAHGSPELAGHLRKQGWNAEHLSPGTQLGLW